MLIQGLEGTTTVYEETGFEVVIVREDIERRTRMGEFYMDDDILVRSIPHLGCQG